MAENRRKILFTDLDGTLLDNKKDIGESTMAAIREMLNRGHIFAICSGRSLESAKIVARQFGLDQPGCYMACYNGGLLYEPSKDKILDKISVPLPYVRRMFDQAQAAGLHIHTYDADGAVIARRHSKELEFYQRHTALPAKVGADILDSLTEEPAKMIVLSLTSHESLQKFQQDNADWAKGKLDSFFSCEQYLEYCPAGVSKGAAVQKLCEYLGISTADAAAVGDERNDIPMLEAAGTAAVPKNAHPKVRPYADYVCEKSNEQGAVGEVIRKFIL